MLFISPLDFLKETKMTEVVNFKNGDVVQLKSGSPTMTIDTALTSGTVRCKWFAGNDVKVEDFHEESLILAEFNN